MTQEQYINTLLKHPTAWSGHAEFAIRLVEQFNPKVTVDLGVDFGFSTFCFAYANKGEVYGIDWFQGDEQTGFRDTLKSVTDMYTELKTTFSIPDISFIKGTFNEVAKSWEKKIDILHIDGLHTFAAVKSDYDIWSTFCHEESIILFHDVEWYSATVGVFFNSLNGYKLIRTGSAGLGVLTRSENKYNIIKNIL